MRCTKTARVVSPVAAIRSHRQKTRNSGNNSETACAMLTPVSLSGRPLHNTGFGWADPFRSPLATDPLHQLPNDIFLSNRTRLRIRNIQRCALWSRGLHPERAQT